VQRLANIRPRAAGVSPPWFGIALAETFDSRLANDATNDTGSVFRVVQRGSVTDVRFAIALGLFVCSAFAQYLLPTFGSQLCACRRQQKTIAVGSDVT
jgi:hypothetical protein